MGVRAVGYRSRGPEAGAGLGTGASSAYWSMEGEEYGGGGGLPDVSA